MLLLRRNAARATYTMLFLSLAAWAGLAQAQARSTADRTFGLAAYVGGSYAQTDYGNSDKGYMVGGDLNTTFHSFEPALDIRYTTVTGTTVNESSFAGGLKIQKKFGPLRPYADFEVGMGTVQFNFAAGTLANGKPYTHDNSVITAYGGGFDMRVARNIDFKADAQYQSWSLGEGNNLTPFITSIGIAYRIPYRSLSSR